jgi:hypothetical protein
VNARSREFSGAAAPARPAPGAGLQGLRVVGTLDLGGGLEARIDGRIADALTYAGTAAG